MSLYYLINKILNLLFITIKKNNQYENQLLHFMLNYLF